MHWLIYAWLAQSVEHETLNLRVVGSSPTSGAYNYHLMTWSVEITTRHLPFQSVSDLLLMYTKMWSELWGDLLRYTKIWGELSPHVH